MWRILTYRQEDDFNWIAQQFSTLRCEYKYIFMIISIGHDIKSARHIPKKKILREKREIMKKYDIFNIINNILFSKHETSKNVVFDDLSKLSLSPKKEEGMCSKKFLRTYFWNIEKNGSDSFENSNFISNKSFTELLGMQVDQTMHAYNGNFNEDDYQIERVATHLEKKSERDFAYLTMVQSIEGHDSQIWAWEISHNYHYIATGCNSGILKVWKVNGMDYDEEPYSLIDQTAFWTMAQNNDENCAILSIAWCRKIPNYLITAQFNKKAVLWDVLNPDAPLAEYVHMDAVTWVVFHPEADEEEMIFITGWIDKTYQVWNRLSKDSICSQQAKDHITAVSISPDGVRVVIGLNNGQLVVCAYDNQKLNYITSIECKNRMGKYSKGTKVTSVLFLDNTDIL